MSRKLWPSEGDFSRHGSFGDGRRFTDDLNAKNYWDEVRRGTKMLNDDEEGRLFLKYLPWIFTALAFGVLLGLAIGLSFRSKDISPVWNGIVWGIASFLLSWFILKKGWRLCSLLWHAFLSPFRGK